MLKNVSIEPRNGSVKKSMEAKERSKMRWNSYRRNISNVFDLKSKITSSEDIIQHSKTLIRSYLLWTWPFLSRKYLEFASLDSENSMIAASLLAIINSVQIEVSHKVLSYLSFAFNNAMKNNDIKSIRTISFIFSSIYRFQIISFDIFMSLLLKLLDKKNAHMSLVLELIDICGHSMEEDNSVEFTQLFTEIVRLAGPSYDKQIQNLTLCRSQNWKDKSRRIPFKFDVLPSYENTIDNLMIENFTEDPTEQLIDGYDFENFDKLYDKHTSIIAAILGSDNIDSDTIQTTEIDTAEDNTESEKETEIEEFIKVKSDKEFQKMIYLTITSTATASEAAHKLIKKLIDEEKRFSKSNNFELKVSLKAHKSIMIETLIEYIGHSQRFDRNLGNIVLFLLSNRNDLIEQFEEYFIKIYSNCNKYKSSQIINITYLLAYLLQNDTINWNVLSIIRLSREETNTEQRLFIRYLMEKLADNRSWLMKKLKEPEIEAAVSGIFLTDTLEHATDVSQFFEAINLDFLVEHVNAKIATISNKPVLNVVIPNSESEDEADNVPEFQEYFSDKSESGSEKESSRRRSKHRHHHYHKRHHRHHH